jgi:hypothetical protein
MSVNDVPGWLVTMVPSAIGEPVAFTPGLVPHCDLLTVVLPLLAAPLLGWRWRVRRPARLGRVSQY